mmetsp:Transcript_6029/g.12579  ORF Transcript_6029/g.12579 Transcript_6029/m.12579 type:complete len:125 (-) Transcript_6029:264-638(-)
MAGVVTPMVCAKGATPPPHQHRRKLRKRAKTRKDSGERQRQHAFWSFDIQHFLWQEAMTYTMEKNDLLCPLKCNKNFWAPNLNKIFEQEGERKPNVMILWDSLQSQCALFSDDGCVSMILYEQR